MISNTKFYKVKNSATGETVRFPRDPNVGHLFSVWLMKGRLSWAEVGKDATLRHF